MRINKLHVKVFMALLICGKAIALDHPTQDQLDHLLNITANC